MKSTILLIATAIGLCRPALPLAKRVAYANIVVKASIDPLLVVALIDHESGWFEGAVSKDRRDYGLGQLRRKFIPKAEWPKLLNGIYNLKKTLWAIETWRKICKGKTGLESAAVVLAGYAGFSRPKEGMWCGVTATGDSLPLLKSTRWILARRDQLDALATLTTSP